jgi:ABC-2 type transport system ATP-binding protein
VQVDNMIIEIKQLYKAYKTYQRGSTFKEVLKGLIIRKTELVPALKGITFGVSKGELIGFLGPNGAGKSTTLKILTGILYPTSGEVKILGYTPWKERKRYVARIGAVFGQKSQLLWDIPPMDAFRMNKAIYDIPDRVFKKILDEMVELLNVQNIVKQPTRLLSLGERMKCEFIMAMLHQPEIVFLDEPTIGLDVIAKEKIREFIRAMNQNGVTFILTTHDLGDVERLARRVIVINHGEIVFDDNIEALRSYTGTKKIILLKTEQVIQHIEGSGITVTKQTSPHEVELEMDTSVLELNGFIESINRAYVIKDMAIHEPPIESVIKQLYATGK